MKEIPKGDWDIKGTWHPVKRENEELSAILECPSCGKSAGLAHEISDNGDVSPSVVCPNEDCSFHEHIKLLNWEK